jgi:hypothetical protein
LLLASVPLAFPARPPWCVCVCCVWGCVCALPAVPSVGAPLVLRVLFGPFRN